MGFGPRAVEGVAVVNRRFWRGRRVFITGHTGFKGAWLSFWLHRLGAEITGYALGPPTRPHLFGVLSCGAEGRFVKADIRDFSALLRQTQRARPEVIFHLAAQSLVRESYRDPLNTYSTNVMGTAHLLEAVRRSGTARAVVIVSSDKCYEENPAIRAYRESDRLGGGDPYSSSKACKELVVSAFRQSFLKKHSMGVASVRAGNVIGGGDWARERLVPDCVRAFRRKEKVQLRLPGAVRPWQHVLEPLRGYLLLAERLYEEPRSFSESWNFGPSQKSFRPVSWVADKLSRLWGFSTGWHKAAGEHPREAGSLRLDSRKAASRLGWKPRWDLDEALAKTAEWYRAYFQREDMIRFTQDQLENFENGSVS